jgi:ribosomal protein L9
MSKELTKEEAKQVLDAAQAAKEARMDEEEAAEKWLKEIEQAPLATQRKMVKQKASYIAIKASISEDSFEARDLNKKSYRMRKALRGAGGVSF